MGFSVTTVFSILGGYQRFEGTGYLLLHVRSDYDMARFLLAYTI
jgi:hypothetical protein